ncbi:YfgJ family double zinc ribbon protein [Chitinilyticum litopenaei]|uniref:YfgJ family double zinc ribbon protein n=1 Tax=Chitinilyticum litopenaei TaxID=1121276 RepID=UPI0004148EE0|nr:zinc-ribbon domain-containing protein [Chitinilyticum litopenaei]
MSDVQTPLPCPDCGKPLDVMKACGATQYFCPHCNELKSGKRVLAQAALTRGPTSDDKPADPGQGD